jgi:hypothetical protein
VPPDSKLAPPIPVGETPSSITSPHLLSIIVVLLSSRLLIVEYVINIIDTSIDVKLIAAHMGMVGGLWENNESKITVWHKKTSDNSWILFGCGYFIFSCNTLKIQ